MINSNIALVFLLNIVAVEIGSFTPIPEHTLWGFSVTRFDYTGA